MNFSILDWSAYAPELASQEAWLNWSKNQHDIESEGQPDVKFLPLMMRRRLGRLSKMAIWTLYQIDESLRKDLSLVFSSRHGNASGTNEILEIIATRAEISPADFSLSVHNACPGQYTIHTKNRQPYTALAAGAESFSMGLFEAISLSLDQSRPILYCYVENDLNPKFQKYLQQKIPPHAICLCIESQSSTKPDSANLTCQQGVMTSGNKIPSLEFLKWLLNPNSSDLSIDSLLISKNCDFH